MDFRSRSNLTTAPYTALTDLNADLGIFAQDKWTLRRLTVTGGVRFDYFNMGIPAQSAPASVWVGARSFDPLPDVPNWKDISPRVGAAYDLFGNGKTAIKASVNRYVASQIYAFASNINPFVTSRNNATRNWFDANHDFIPQGDPLRRPAAKRANFLARSIRTSASRSSPPDTTRT